VANDVRQASRLSGASVRRVLLISPHFPPDATAGAHRVRLLAPHLAKYGWEPTVLTCAPSAYEGRLDPDLPGFLPASLRVIRVNALPVRWTRRLGVGDLGLRSLPGLYRAAARLLAAEHFDALFITIFPAYTALLGPRLSRRFGVPFVLDYQDPWVNAWGMTVGGGRGGRVDLKSRASRWLAEMLEPHAVRTASAITAVSPGTYEPILERNPGISPVTAAIPIGTDPGDFAERRVAMDADVALDPDPALVNVCCTGAILPLGYETLRAFLTALADLRRARPELAGRLRVHFVGTSNQMVATTECRVLPIAQQLGVADLVRETPTRIPYSQAVALQQRAGALLALGSSEPHYTGSKIFPLLLARRPLLAVYHERSTVTTIVREVARPPSVRLVTYDDAGRAATSVAAIARHLGEICEHPVWRESDVDMAGLREYFAESLAGRLAGVLDQVVLRRAS
jgi:hypothetical protein